MASPKSNATNASASADSAYNLDKLPPISVTDGKKGKHPFVLRKAGSVDVFHGSLTQRLSARAGRASIDSATPKASATVAVAAEAHGKSQEPRWARQKWRKAILTVEASNAIQEKGRLHQVGATQLLCTSLALQSCTPSAMHTFSNADLPHIIICMLMVHADLHH
jgi:hypothetical protein